MVEWPIASNVLSINSEIYLSPNSQDRRSLPKDTIVFIGSEVADYQSIVSAINLDVTVVVYDGQRGGLPAYDVNVETPTGSTISQSR